MWSFEHLLENEPDLVNPGGEEVWFCFGSKLVLIRLKPGTKSLIAHHLFTQETYTVVKGNPRFYYACDNFNLTEGQQIIMTPPFSHQVFNDTQTDVLLLGKLEIPWSIQIL